MLNKALRADIPDLNRMVGRARSDAGAIRVETHRIHSFVMVLESADSSLAGDIPKFDAAVIGTRCDEASIGREFG